jgi:hypothetical protein
MTLNSVIRRVPGFLVAVAVVTTSAGCYTMARVPPRYITTEKPAEVFVRDAEGSVYSLANPTILHDSLVGQDGPDQMSVNLREVDAMVVRRISPAKTAGFVATSVGVVSLVTFGVLKATVLKDCVRIPNKNNQCAEFVEACKYSCAGTPDPDAP